MSRRAVAALSATLLLTGCGTASEAPATLPTGSVPPAPVSPRPPEAAGSESLRIGLAEWAIVLGAEDVLAPGEVELEILNAGGTAHDLVVTGRLGTWATPVLAPGESHVLRVRTAPGEVLDLVCTVTGHRAHGMVATLSVARE